MIASRSCGPTKAAIRTVLLALSCCMPAISLGDESAGATFERAASLRDLFPADQVDSLSSVISADREVHWTLHVPQGTDPPGVLVFVSPNSSGTPPRDWARILDEKKLIWVAAQKFGNPIPARQRVLAAVMGLTYVEQQYTVDASRVYVAGMSGGGRVASVAITEFPRLFTGALYIVGVNFWDEQAAIRLDQIRRKRYVFLTGDHDFNRGETRSAYKRYVDAGATQSLLMDLPHFGHQYPNAEQLKTAIEFLDVGHTSNP